MNILKLKKRSAATTVKNEEKLREEYASFQGNTKRKSQGKSHKLNGTMYLWYTNCCAANLYPTGVFKQEKGLQMKERMVEAVPELYGFCASNGWLESFKMTYGIRKIITTTAGESGTNNDGGGIDGKTSRAFKKLLT